MTVTSESVSVPALSTPPPSPWPPGSPELTPVVPFTFPPVSSAPDTVTVPPVTSRTRNPTAAWWISVLPAPAPSILMSWETLSSPSPTAPSEYVCGPSTTVPPFRSAAAIAARTEVQFPLESHEPTASLVSVTW